MNNILINICKEVRIRQLEKYQTVEGACREVTIAIAFEAVKANISLCICVGTYEDNEHYWLRHENTIYDATASQFGATDDVLVVHESDAIKFNEVTFIYINSNLINLIIN